MKSFLLVAILATVSAPALAGVSVEVGEPGFFGRIEIGNFPRPPLVCGRPVVIERVPVTVVREPICGTARVNGSIMMMMTVACDMIMAREMIVAVGRVR